LIQGSPDHILVTFPKEWGTNIYGKNKDLKNSFTFSKVGVLCNVGEIVVVDHYKFGIIYYFIKLTQDICNKNIFGNR